MKDEKEFYIIADVLFSCGHRRQFVRKLQNNATLESMHEQLTKLQKVINDVYLTGKNTPLNMGDYIVSLAETSYVDLYVRDELGRRINTLTGKSKNSFD